MAQKHFLGKPFDFVNIVHHYRLIMRADDQALFCRYLYIAVGRYRRAEPFFLRQQQQTDGGASGGFENKGQASKGFFSEQTNFRIGKPQGKS